MGSGLETSIMGSRFETQKLCAPGLDTLRRLGWGFKLMIPNQWAPGLGLKLWAQGLGLSFDLHVWD